MPDYIKVDRSYVVRAVGAEEYREFLRHLLKAAAVFTSEGIIAEGVEQPSELRVARELGISHAQGFLLGRPAPTAEAGVVWPADGGLVHRG